MRWLAVTVALLTLSTALVAGIYVRDRDTNWRPPAGQLVRADAADLLAHLTLDPTCHGRCATEVHITARANHWFAQITIRSRTQCFEIDADTFAWTPAHGFSGVDKVSCETSARTAPGPAA
jgi:hypothetical protein